MILHEELYILVNGERRKIEIKTPSGISLKFQSNMFNDLSKFCASYSYTFKIPKTRSNIEAFDLVEDLRHSSSVYGKRIECEFYREGIKLFDNSYLYINEAGENYSAVMTWNVLSWLLEISEDGKSIKDIEKDLGGSQLTSVTFGEDKSSISNSQSMEDPSVSALYRCGTPFVTRRPNLVPIRYLLNKIARYYGKEDATKIFSFMRSAALTNTDLSGSVAKHHIAEDGVIPLVSGKWSNAYLQIQTRKSDRHDAANYTSNYPTLDPFGGDIGQTIGSVGVMYRPTRTQYLRFGDLSGAKDFLRMMRCTGTAVNNAPDLGVESTEWTYTKEDTGIYIGFAPANSSMRILLRGRIRLTDYYALRIVPYFKVDGSIYKYAPEIDEEGEIEDAIEIDATAVEGSSNLYEINFDPEEGGNEIEIEPVEGVQFWAIELVGYDTTFITDGYLKFLPGRDNVEIGEFVPSALNKVDLFNNLPDLKIIDLLKSLFYIENAYPIIEKDGRIGQMLYDDLFQNIEEGKVYDWSDLLIGESKNDTIKFAYDTLGRVNRFNMKNYSSNSRDEQETPLQYDSPTAYFNTLNESINAENTIFSFPFASAASVTNNGFSAGETFIFWEYDEDKRAYKAAGSVEPIIGRLRDYKEETIWSLSNYKHVDHSLKFDIWQVSGQIYENTAMAKILQKPYVVTTKILIDTYTLSTIDFTKPVYLQRYNSYFGIVSIQCDSKGISKVELIKIPTDAQNDTILADLEISIEGSPIVYKKSGTNALALYNVSASVKGSRINRMVIKVDGEEIEDANIERASITESFDYGTHTLEVTAYAQNGRSATASYETRVNYAAEGISIDFLAFQSALTISNTKENVATYSAAVYNASVSGTLKIFKNVSGSSQKVLLGQSSSGTISVDWSFFDQLSNGLSPVTWILTAAFYNSAGVEVISNSKSVYVSVDSRLQRYYNGAISGVYFFIAKTNTYQEGSAIHNIFSGTTFTASYIVAGGEIPPYYVEICFTCYAQLTGSSSYEYIHRIDPYKGSADNITLSQSQFGSYARIKVTAKAYFNAQGNTIFNSGEIWLYRD